MELTLSAVFIIKIVCCLEIASVACWLNLIYIYMYMLNGRSSSNS